MNLVYFGYTQCPDVCPLTLSLMGSVFRQLSPEERGRIRFIFINVDHRHAHQQDTAGYATHFYPDFVGLDGSEQQIQEVIRQFPASYTYHEDPGSYLGYSISHTDRVFIVNKKGVIIGAFPGSSGEEKQILNTLKEYL
ncbi:MAG: SCO family protein [Pseudobdellovibrionaceae bacterium]|nr:SCO family protein [Pseudobdellovibrionaceae bacterium]